MYYYQAGISSEIEAADGLHKLYLMNPNTNNNYDNMLFSNSTSAAATVQASPLTQAHHQFVGIPQLSYDPSRPSSVISHQQEIQATQNNIIPWSASVDHQAANGNQTLSLSLSPHQITGFNKSLHQDFYQGRYSSINYGIIDRPKMSSSSSSSSNGVVLLNSTTTARSSLIMGSKFLKAAQELLDEVADVGKGVKSEVDKAKIVKESNIGGVKAEVALSESGGGTHDHQLTTAQRQDIEMKKAKLFTMLDEVEQRYRLYQNQMQIIVTSFEQAAGIGSAKTYTQLALKTISKQFRCLKDAISAQIKALSKTLCEEEINLGEKFEGLKRKFVDYQFQNNNNNVWRHQRGLPERAVSVLRAWLFDHFLHPYPKDSDKQILAKQTGLTRSQVSNWFINARVRLWKPMVEKMYLEEMKNDHEENTTKTEVENKELTSSTPEKNPQKPRDNNILSSELEMETNSSTYGIGELDQLAMTGIHGNNHNNKNSNIFSLTLALPPSGTHRHDSFSNYPRNFDREFGSRMKENGVVNGLPHASSSSHPNNINGYDILDFQNRHLLPDFLA